VSNAQTAKSPWQLVLEQRPEFVGFSFTGPLRPSTITPKRIIPAHIMRPDYADRSGKRLDFLAHAMM